VKLIADGHLAFFLPGRKSPVEVFVQSPVPLTVVLADVGIPLGEVNLAAVNGRAVDLHKAVVRDHDEVNVISAVNGG
jgi:sulfur carrier protein ThiS